MIPPHRAHFHREVQHVQQYIQSRLQTEEPSVLSVNAAQMDEYYDEMQNYVKQKQRLSQVRRPLPTSQQAPSPTSSKSFSQPSPVAKHSFPPTSAHSFSHPSPVAAHSFPPTSANSFSHPPPVTAHAFPPTSAHSFTYGSDRSSPPSPAHLEPRAPPSPSSFRLPGVKWLLGSRSPRSPGTDPVLPFAAHSANSQRILKKQKTL